MIADDLSGQRIAITGATGFLGTALVERLLRSVSDCHLVLLVRPGRRASAARRVEREILRNDAFDRLRSELGDDFDSVMAERITTVAGDVGADGLGLDAEGRAAFAGCDIVIHSAATVSFDSPLDASVQINLLGPNRIVSLLQEEESSAHLVAVSTCYVAGNRRGRALEQFLTESPFQVDADWRAEVAAAERSRADKDAMSREPSRLREFRRAARQELGAAGLPLIAAKTEQLRERWVDDQMVEAGRARASSLGWPDVYTYSKALGEQALLELRGDVPITVVRPSIIESALTEPFPGWIRGFRMAEPLIISYAKGELTQFPGNPEGIVDVIPVDLVAAAIIAAAAEPPPADPAVYQVASGSVRPLEYRMLTETVREWFTEKPIYDAKGQAIAPAPWEFTGSSGLEERLERLVRGLRAADRTVASLPLRGRQGATSQKLQERIDTFEQALGYVKIYGAYGRCEAIYDISRLDQLRERMEPADQEAFVFDPREIDWRHYIRDVHLPTVVVQARVRQTPGARQGPSREDRLRSQALSSDRHFAAFDLENTLISSNVVESYAWLATRHLDTGERLKFAARLAVAGPRLLAEDSRDRTDFLRSFYRRYRGAPIDQIDADAEELLSRLLLVKAFPAGLRRVREHRRAGHRTVLITGALDAVIAPLRPLFDDVIAAEMRDRPDGTFAGELSNVPPTGETRAEQMLDWAAGHGFDPRQGVAYADATSDLPMLEAVGFPVAVNPETRLIGIAEKRGWLIEDWRTSPGTPKPLLPIGPRPARHSTTGRHLPPPRPTSLRRSS